MARPPPTQIVPPDPSTWVVGGIAVLLLIISVATGGIAALLITLGVVALLTAGYVVITGRRSWAMLPSRRTGAVGLGVAVLLMIGGGAAYGIAATHSTVQLAGASGSTTSPRKVTPTPSPVVTVKEESMTAPVPFGQVAATDPNVLVGTTTVTVTGINGVKTTIFRVTYTDGAETARDIVSDEITTPPVDQVTTTGTKQPVAAPKPVAPAPKPVAPAPVAPAPAPPAAPASSCDPNYAGQCVPISSDVDCAGGSGDGPAYLTGTVTVIGRDIYDLDRDHDGIGCD